MAKYTKRADGRYQARITVGRDENGKRKIKSIYGKTIKELDAKLVEYKSLKNKGLVVTDNKITLKEYSQKWLEAYKQGVEYNTYEMYRTCVENHIKTSSAARLPMSKIKNDDLQMLINNKLNDGLTRTVEIIILTLKQIFKKAIKNNIVYANPADGLEKPATKAKPKRALLDIENEAIKTASLSDRERAFVYFGKYCGLRRGEILAITKSDIDIEAKTVTVNKTVVFEKNTGVVKPMPKTVAGFRTIPIPRKIINFTRRYTDKLETEGLFVTKKGAICTRSSMRKMWTYIIKKLNDAIKNDDGAEDTNDAEMISGLTPHILRHDYATSLYKAGVDVKTAQKLLGHSDIKMTLQIYTHLDQDNDAIQDKLDKIYDDE